MADIADKAQSQIDNALTAALSNATVYRGKSSLYCCECGEPIPEARRDAVPGCSLCVYCQQKEEYRGKHGLSK